MGQPWPQPLLDPNTFWVNDPTLGENTAKHKLKDLLEYHHIKND